MIRQMVGGDRQGTDPPYAAPVARVAAKHPAALDRRFSRPKPEETKD